MSTLHPQTESSIHPEQPTFAIGETAGTGAYRCSCCEKYTAVLLGPTDQIPPCEICGNGGEVRFYACDDTAEDSHGVPEERREG
ncbi:MAG: hypothetical protein KDA61_03895 [Planctomycetales bacterium]|nr:hypothetical protein [Planctomycetales bacterium]